MAGTTVRINGLDVGDGHPVRVMGVLNLSPESFYAGSVLPEDRTGGHAAALVAAGADLLDLGGRSTAPRSRPITVEEECRRVEVAIRSLVTDGGTGETPISVDTQHRVVAEAALSALRAAGLERLFVLNDVSCLTTDPELAVFAADVDCPVILMAAHDRPGDSRGLDEIIRDLETGIGKLSARGMSVRRRVIVDPAIGKWTAARTTAHDCEILRDLERLRVLGLPILVGISRKSFIGEILGKPDPADRLAGTQAATAVAVAHGAHVVRTHDVTPQTLETVRLAWAIRRGGAPAD